MFETFKPFNNIEKEKKSNQEEVKSEQTPRSLRNGAEKIIDMFCEKFEVVGKDNIEKVKKENPDEKFIITSSHFSNLDGPAAIKVLGEDFNLQIAVESLHFGWTPQEVMYRIGGKENFSPLEYRKSKKSKFGVFNPKDFENLSEKMNQGKTPWVGIHPFTTKGEMQEARVGPIYLAQLTGAKIIPTALEVRGGSISLGGPQELIKGFVKKIKAKYHIGEPLQLPPLDVSIINIVLAKRKNKEKITPDEFKKFQEVHQQLKAQADEVAQIISEMLPEDQRGIYPRNDKN